MEEEYIIKQSFYVLQNGNPLVASNLALIMTEEILHVWSKATNFIAYHLKKSKTSMVDWEMSSGF